MGTVPAGARIIKAMETQVITAIRTLSDDDVYELWADADDQHNPEIATAAQAEIVRRCNRPAPTSHNVPKWLTWLPRGMWHTKPSGGGEGS